MVMAKKGVIEFGKAQVSSLVSTACDFLVTAIVFRLAHHVVASTASGAISGGIVNCIINYCWTFRGTSRSKRGVVWRYLLVWAGSVFLNTVGTEYGVKAVRLLGDTLDVDLSQTLGIVLIVKAIIATFVAIFWNFFMQKYYVYRKSKK